MMNHIDQHILESLILNSEAVSVEESARINAHLSECRLCAEQWRRLKELYRVVDENLQQSPTRRDEEFAERLLESKRVALPERGLERRSQDESLRETLESYAEVIEPYRRRLVQRFVRYARLYPLRTASATAFAAGAIVLSLLLTRTPKDTNPTHATVKDYVLSVFNKEGVVLFTKPALGIPDGKSGSMFDVGAYPRRIVALADIDDDGTNEVLISGGLRQGSFTEDTVYSFNKNGALRWKAGVGKMISFGEKGISQHSTQIVVDFFVMRKTPDQKPQLFVLARDLMFSPTKLLEVDPETGAEKKAYFNRGHCKHVLHYDIDKDGQEEIVIGGINDGFNRACLSVLDPSNAKGYAPVPPYLMPLDVEPAHEKYYLLLPISQLAQRTSTAPYNEVARLIERNDGGIVVAVRDIISFGYEGVSVVFTLNRNLKAENVVLGDGSQLALDALVKAGRLRESPPPDYWNTLKDSVLYWNGDQFVNTPTMNTRYRAAKPLP